MAIKNKKVCVIVVSSVLFALAVFFIALAFGGLKSLEFDSATTENTKEYVATVKRIAQNDNWVYIHVNEYDCALMVNRSLLPKDYDLSNLASGRQINFRIYKRFEDIFENGTATSSVILSLQVGDVDVIPLAKSYTLDKKDNMIMQTVFTVFALIAIIIGVIILLCVFLKHNKKCAGEKCELFAVASESIAKVKKYRAIEELVLYCLDEDEYGRILFGYLYKNLNVLDKQNPSQYVVNLIISQGSDARYAYFYKGRNCISSPLCDDNIIKIFGNGKPIEIENHYNGFTKSSIDKLKENNDWGKVPELSKCAKVRIL